MNETEIRALGFEPWYGGDEAPGDIQPETKALYRDGSESYSYADFGYCWKNTGSASDIIGYKKNETPMEYPEWVMNRVQKLWNNYPALCQHILDHEQPPVDPDLELARKHYDSFINGDYGAEEAMVRAIKEARNA